MASPREIHNEMAGEIVRLIVKPPLDAGGEFSDVLVLLETVILGVMLIAVKLGGDGIVLDAVMERVKERLAEQRLSNIDPKGSA
jgi:hypothetical protein